MAVRPSPYLGGMQRRRHAIDIAAQQRREISIDHGGVTASDELHQRTHLMARRDLREARRAGKRRRFALMLRVGVSMHEDDGDRGDAVGARGAKRRDRRRMIERRLDAAVGAHALRHFGHARIEHRRLFDTAREDFRPCLVADLQRIAKALADDEEERIALALEQRVGGDRGAHPHRRDRVRRKRSPPRAPEQISDTGNRRIRIGFRILRQQLMREEAPVRRPRHDVGEGAAAIDEELPSAAAVHPMRFNPAA